MKFGISCTRGKFNLYIWPVIRALWVNLTSQTRCSQLTKIRLGNYLRFKMHCFPFGKLIFVKKNAIKEIEIKLKYYKIFI